MRPIKSQRLKRAGPANVNLASIPVPLEAPPRLVPKNVESHVFKGRRSARANTKLDNPSIEMCWCTFEPSSPPVNVTGKDLETDKDHIR